MIKRQVLILIPNLGPGGAQKVFLDQLQLLSRHFHVTGCVFNWCGVLTEERELNIVSLDVPAGKNGLDKFYQFLVRCVKYRRLKAQLNVDASISHMEGANYVNFFSGGKPKTILIEHGSKVADAQNKNSTGAWLRRNLLMPLVYRNATSVVAVSEGLKKELISHFRVPEKKISVIQNSFDIKAVEDAAAEPLLPVYEKVFSRLVIITSGRLALQKNQAPLLSIIRRVKERISCCLVLLGDGQLKNDLIDLARQLGLVVSVPENILDNADIYFLGYQPNPFQYLSKARLFVFPSAFEGFPLALCEAMICGVPVMSTDCRTGPREILAPLTNDQYENLNHAERAQYGVLMPLLNNDNAVDCWVREITQLLTLNEVLNEYGKLGKIRMQDFKRDGATTQWVNLIG